MYTVVPGISTFITEAGRRRLLDSLVVPKNVTANLSIGGKFRNLNCVSATFRASPMVVFYTHASVCEIRLVSSGIIEESAVSLATITVLFGIVESGLTLTIRTVPTGVSFAVALGRTFISIFQITIIIAVDLARFVGKGKTKTGSAPAFSRRLANTEAVWNSRAVDIDTASVVAKGKTGLAEAFSRRLGTGAVWNSRTVDYHYSCDG